MFEVCGKVTYVSLPRFKESRELKGFGFIEFESLEGAQAAVVRFRSHKSGTTSLSFVLILFSYASVPPPRYPSNA